MDEQLASAIDELASDSTSGASTLTARAAALLRRAAASGRNTLEEAAARIQAAHPAMAGLRKAVALALVSPDAAAALHTFEQQCRRALPAIVRHTAALLELRPPPIERSRPLRIVTCSRSAAVEATLTFLSRRGPLEISCAESRPALEGRALAIALATTPATVRVFSDAGISAAVGGADAVLVGADAVGPESFINKVGTGALCARASVAGVPVYVLASREKFVSAAEYATLTLRAGDPAGVWADAPPEIQVSHSIFEHIPRSLISAIVTDAGALSTWDI